MDEWAVDIQLFMRLSYLVAVAAVSTAVRSVAAVSTAVRSVAAVSTAVRSVAEAAVEVRSPATAPSAEAACPCLIGCY